MIIHKDYDCSLNIVEKDYKLPTEITRISISHDGGRISIQINNEDVYYSSFGTRDCNIEINRD